MSEVAQPMPGRLAEIEARLDRHALTETCKDEEGCSVSLGEIGPAFLLVNPEVKRGSPIPPGRKRCDFIAFAERDAFLHVAVLELKSGGFDPDEVKEQLQEGARAVESICPWRKQDRFHAVLVHGRGLRKWERQRKTIRFHDAHHPIRREACGISMLKILRLESSLPSRRRMPRQRRR